MNLQDLISQLMHDHGLTQAEIASKVGCTQGTISGIYRGSTKNPGYSLVVKLDELNAGRIYRRKKAA